ncbi:restriction endonuclease subunit S [Leclercia adecarboxylata]|uniref:restriction endonuclease subunit S n=1 Tax=Enterobacteriaceae TaxID=543 RepID=UPI001119353F|nr:restriction endonuclease subunit S [Leclercia adecarboxylata]QCZ29958.1 restriction endonuclease subunit S [Leclercia adecarboxylata]
MEQVPVLGKYQQYPEYKDSDTQWIGNVPLTWQVKRLGQFLFERREKVSDKDFEPLSVTKHGIVPQLDTAAKTDAGDNRKLVRSGDFVINSRSDRKGSSGLSERDGSVSLISIVMKPKDIHPQFVHHLLRSYPFQEEFYRWGKGIVADLWSTNYGEMKNILLPIPSQNEQRTIAVFLDYETTRIDKLIAKQQRLIELLKEKRQAVISHAVTKGLNPDAVMKDSGVEWLGEVPEHWAFVKLKWIATTTSGSTPNTGEQEKYYADGVYPWVRTTDLNNDILSDIPVKITEQALADTACSLLPPGTVLIAMYGGAGSIGKHALLSVPSTTNQAVCAILPTDSVIPEFLNLFAGFYRPYWMVGAEGTRKDPNIGQDHIKELKLPIPPLLEQKLICAQINQKLSQYSVAEDKAFKFTWLLQERRTALISAAVTGKIDLRGWTAPTEEASNG